jgi:DNA-binding IscR family transcriptional regulator
MPTNLVVYGMKVSKKARYGLRLMLKFANTYSCGPVAMCAIAEKEGISEKIPGADYAFSTIEIPIVSVHGPRGGYSLVVHLSKITVKSILNVFEPLELVECVSDAGACIRSARYFSYSEATHVHLLNS